MSASRCFGLLVLLLVLLLTMIAGCETSTRNTRPSKPTTYVSVDPIDRQQLESTLATNLGQVILIDYWATWCTPCMRQFPHTVSMDKIYGLDGLKVIAISLDEPGDLQKVQEFLQVSHADFDNYISIYNSVDESIAGFDIEGGGVPYYQLYDRKGRLRYKYSGPPVGIELRVEELLAEGVVSDE